MIVWAISEHVENAGVHSGDATLVLPPQRMYLETTRKIKSIARNIAKALNITGPFNIQFLAKDNDVQVIECNLRASRSFPFVSKVFKVNFIDIATRVIIGEEIPKLDKSAFELDYVGVKAAQFSFKRLEGADPSLSVEMASTGEVACFGDDFNEALLKAMLSVGFEIKGKNLLLSTGPIKNKIQFLGIARNLVENGFKLFATEGTANFMFNNEIKCETLHWPLENKKPNVLDHIKNGKIDLVLNIPKNFREEEITNDYLIRRTAADFGIPLITNMQLARAYFEAILKLNLEDLEVKAWDEY